MDDLRDLKYHPEYGLILLMGISRTSDFGRYFKMKENKDSAKFICSLTHKGYIFKVLILSLFIILNLYDSVLEYQRKRRGTMRPKHFWLILKLTMKI